MTIPKDFFNPGTTVKDIVRVWLELNGYTGLCQEGCPGCGCALDNLFPGGYCDGQCVPGHRATREELIAHGEDPDDHMFDLAGTCDYIIEGK